MHTSVHAPRDPTAQIALDAADRMWMPVRRSWRLNERHYGALQGKDKKQTLEEFGEEQFMLWRRSYDTPPPPLADDDEWSQVGDPRYADLPAEVRAAHRVPQRRRRAHAAVLVRRDRARPAHAAATVLVAAHGNSLRALVKHLDGISDDDIAGLNIPTGIPLLYDLDARPAAADRGRRVPRPRRRGGRDRGGQEPGPLSGPATDRIGRDVGVRTAYPVRDGPRGSGGLGELARVLPGHQVDHAAGDRDGVVGEALVVAADQGHVDRRLDAVRRARVEQLR